MNKKQKTSAFAGLGDVLAGGFDESVTSQETDVMLPLDQIEVVAQVRSEFEDEENTLQSLAESMQKLGQIQSIVVRPIDGALPYQLVAGERRIRAARLAGWTEMRARIVPLDDHQAADVQFAENIHRKNLALIEEARRVQADLDELGSVDAVLAKHNKGRAWLSKLLSLLALPKQAGRLIDEKISSDLEVINSVKTIEKADPKKAKALVDDLKKTRGKEDARKKVEAVKAEVKPKKKRPASSDESGAHVFTGDLLTDGGNEGLAAIRKDNQDKAAAAGTSVATSRDRSQEEPGEARVFSVAFRQQLQDCYDRIHSGERPGDVLDAMDEVTRADFDDLMRSNYEAGKRSAQPGRDVLRGLDNGVFGGKGCVAFALAAFLLGVGDLKYSLLDVAVSVKE